MKICLIGNSGIKTNDKGGQTIKLRFYMKKIEDEGLSLFFVDLEFFFRHPLFIFLQIKKGIKECDRIVFISGERACKLLVPYINRINKKYNRPFVLPVVGSGVLHYSIDYLSDVKSYHFFVDKDYSLAKKKNTIANNLRKITTILTETDLLNEVYSSFYSLNNCVTLTNLREFTFSNNKPIKSNKKFKIVYLSRIMKIKGVFDLLYTMSNKQEVDLDMFGQIDMRSADIDLFNRLKTINVHYLGELDNSRVKDILMEYDLFIFPTRAPYEGVPGVISESLIAGTPILTSNFPNAKYILKNGYDSIFYEMFNVNDFKSKLEWCINNKEKIRAMRKNCLESSKKFTYEYNRKDFLKYVCGVEEE